MPAAGGERGKLRKESKISHSGPWAELLLTGIEHTVCTYDNCWGGGKDYLFNFEHVKLVVYLEDRDGIWQVLMNICLVNYDLRG